MSRTAGKQGASWTIQLLLVCIMAVCPAEVVVVGKRRQGKQAAG